MHYVSLFSTLAVSAMAIYAAPAGKPGVTWIRAGPNGDRPWWGIQGGLVWGLPVGQRPDDGPRGLIRLWYPTLGGGRRDLINFIAVEPVVKGRRGFSELERSRLDGVRGLRLRAEDPAAPAAPSAGGVPRGDLMALTSGAQRLTVLVRVETFANGAHVALTVSQRSDRPDEIELGIRAEPDSAPVDYCILTATMGNKARARQLWLKSEVASSLELYPAYKEDGFAPHKVFPLDRLHRTEAGEMLAAITTDEADPASVDPFPRRSHWRYRGFPVTQYWKKPAGAWRDDLHVAVNGRYTYWLSRHPIPGGIAFENFEMRERFHDGQCFIFGITRSTPAELGFTARPPERAPVQLKGERPEPGSEADA